MICILKTFHFRSGCACDAMPSCSSTTSQCPRAVTLYIVAFDRFDSARNARNREIHKGPLAYAVNRLNLIPSGQCTFITGKQSSVELRQNQQRRGCVQCWYCAVRLRCLARVAKSATVSQSDEAPRFETAYVQGPSKAGRQPHVEWLSGHGAKSICRFGNSGKRKAFIGSV